MSMTTKVRSPLKWIVGKFHSAVRILAAFLPADWYETYHEPCGGAAHVLMVKPTWRHREINNDLYDDLRNFWIQAPGWFSESPAGWNNCLSSVVAYHSVLVAFTQVQTHLTHPREIIDNREVERVIEEYDSPTTLHYVDPPYIGAEYYYQIGVSKHARNPFDHGRQAEILLINYEAVPLWSESEDVS
jgi:site-specific DNA-adenine methylase